MIRAIMFLLAYFPLFCHAQQRTAIIDVCDGYLAGFYYNGNYHNTDSAKLLLKGGELYNLYGLKGFIDTARGNAPENRDAACPATMNISVNYKSEAGAEVIGITGTWDAYPKSLKFCSRYLQTYIDITSGLLHDFGLKDPYVELTSVIQTDLDGDGIDESIISATHYEKGFGSDATADDYSVVFVRKLIGGKMENIVINGDFYPHSEEFGAPLKFTLACVLDIDGDGTYEIITREEYYEGTAVSVYKINGNKAERVLKMGCGT
jgi:hypothetical protein